MNSKPMTRTLILVTLLSTLLAANAFAVSKIQEDLPLFGLKPGNGHGSALLEKFDTDKDGQLNDAEKAVVLGKVKEYTDAKEADALKKFDADKDGRLNADEQAARNKAELEAEIAIYDSFDKDGDGKVSTAERKAGGSAFTGGDPIASLARKLKYGTSAVNNPHKLAAGTAKYQKQAKE
ncbi:EF-hand domain-containing protein [Neorhodopirellula lusitana]|uniref:EF-hand domain-containing protein n=1 Tax=Neorhodopirellula lusitana TaxID=445327 RepID=UPI00384A7FA8